MSASSSSGPIRIDVPRFYGKTRFTLWQVRMISALKSIGCYEVIIGDKPASTEQSRWDELSQQAISLIYSALDNLVLSEEC